MPAVEPLLTETADLSPVALEPGQRLQVAATSSIIADVVSEVGGEKIDLALLIPIGADPHSYEPAPRDLATIARGHVVFANGFGLEGPLLETLGMAARGTPILSLSAGIAPRRIGESGLGPMVAGGPDDDAVDPHVWLDPTNVMAWVKTIESGLSALSPDAAADFSANALAYLHQLEDLDAWIEAQVNAIPPESRKLITDHNSLGYFADRYGFELVGAITSGFSTGAEPSARELAALQESISLLGVRAVFVGTTIDPRVSELMAEDAGVMVLPLHSGSLSAPDGPAPTYIDLMRYNVRTIVDGLR